MAVDRWTPEQLVVAFALYCQTPFGKMHRTNPEIVRTAKILGRTPSSLAMKLVNFASLDPAIIKTGRKGLGNASMEDKKVWDAFHADWEQLALQSAKIGSDLGAAASVSLSGDDEDVDEIESFEADGKRAWMELRTKQAFFRKAVTSSYHTRCCMSGLGVPSLLIASHIIPWKIDRSNRLNPRNGLCLSALHDRAFDKGLITVTPEMRIKVSKELKRSASEKFLASSRLSLEGERLTLPEKFLPEPRFLEYHVKNIFQG